MSCSALSFFSNASAVLAFPLYSASTSFSSEDILRSSLFIDVTAALNSASPSMAMRVDIFLIDIPLSSLIRYAIGIDFSRRF